MRRRRLSNLDHGDVVLGIGTLFPSRGYAPHLCETPKSVLFILRVLQTGDVNSEGEKTDVKHVRKQEN
jgi:hypothetical protein